MTHTPDAQLPGYSTPFFGREADMRSLSQVLRDEDVRLVTITGLGGLGKTRLAATVAHQIAGSFPHGVVFVPLSDVTDWQQLPTKIAVALKLQPDMKLEQELAKRTMLLVLDSFEHVLEAGTMLTHLLTAAPGLTLLVTSRTSIRVHGEHLYPLGALESPANTEMFIWHARAVQPNLPSVPGPVFEQIVTKLDGIPLAIELAAARCRTLSLEELRDRLPEHLQLLTSQEAARPERQHTLESAIAWTFQLLSSDEQTLARRLSIFPAGCTFQAAVHLMPEHQESELIHMLEHVLDYGLLRSISQSDGSLRFTMPETIRAFGLRNLEQHHEYELIAGRVVSWCIGFSAGMPLAIMGAADEATLNRLGREIDTIRFALRTCVDRTDGESALQIINPIWSWFHHRGHIAEGISWLDRALGITPETTETARLIAQARLGKAFLHWAHGDLDQADELSRCVEQTYRELGRPVGIGFAMMCRSLVAEARHELPLALEMLHEALTQFQIARHEFFIAHTQMTIGRISLELGDADAAETNYRNALVHQRQIGNKWSTIFTMNALGELAMMHHRPDDALHWYEEAWHLSLQLGHTWASAESMAGIASVASMRGLVSDAARLCGCVDQRFVLSQIVPPPTARRILARTLSTLRANLASSQILQLREEGKRMSAESADQLVARTLTAVRDINYQVHFSSHLVMPLQHPLTDREIDVLRLLVQGQTNQEIAAELNIRISTVKVHITHILQKYGANSRTAVIAHALGTDQT